LVAWRHRDLDGNNTSIQIWEEDWSFFAPIAPNQPDVPLTSVRPLWDLHEYIMRANIPPPIITALLENEPYLHILNAFLDFQAERENDWYDFHMRFEEHLNTLHDTLAGIIRQNENCIEHISVLPVRFGNVYFSLHDINNDGIPELFIGGMLIVSRYEDSPYLVGGFWERRGYELFDCGTIEIFSASGGGAGTLSYHYLATDGSGLQLVERFGWNWGTYHHTTSYGIGTEKSEEEFYMLLADFQATLGERSIGNFIYLEDVRGVIEAALAGNANN